MDFKELPKILFVHALKIKLDDTSNLLIRMQFGDWPKEKMAQIHATAEPDGIGDFCSMYYPLGKMDRFLGNIFIKLRGRVFDMVSMDIVEDMKSTMSISFLERSIILIKNILGDLLIQSGIWEILFPLRLSPSILKFINDFNPDLIYCQGYTLGFATLPLLISKKLNIPICFQTTDDWPYERYGRSPVNWLIRYRANQLIKHSSVRLAFGKKMQYEYQRRYKVSFDVTYHLDDPKRFLNTSWKSDNTEIMYRIIYTGNMSLRRYEAIQDVLKAVRQMPELHGKIKIFVYTTGIPKDLPIDLLTSPEVVFTTLPSHEKLPSVLAEATLLLLPESFNEVRSWLEYSISTKVHLYLMSGRPILVYGPSYSGTVEYAISEDWGIVVSERSVEKLITALRVIITDTDRMQKIENNAKACIRNNHDLARGLVRFREYIAKGILLN